MNKFLYLDFEYNKSSNHPMNLVCCGVQIEQAEWGFWLHNDKKGWDNLKEFLKEKREDHIFVAWNVVAEANSVISLGLDPRKIKWWDIQLEYKMLVNHYDNFRYGKQLIDGKEVRTSRPLNKWETELAKGSKNHARPQTNLAAAMYKILNIKIDTKHKDEMRNLIISNPDSFSPIEKIEILSYCREDVKYLPKLRDKVDSHLAWSSARGHLTLEQTLWRGETAARTALMTQTGYPVDREMVTNFSKAVPTILGDMAKDINEQFPDMKLFTYNKKTDKYSKREAPQREWIASLELKKPWRMTDGGAKGIKQFSLALDAYTDHFAFSHDYPRGNFGAQMVRYLKTNQSLNGFKVSKKTNFFDAYGDDDRARAWLNPYGSQSSRYQPKATGFIPLKAAWMRSLIKPKGGKLIASIDYGSEEFLLSAILSGDKNMFEAYTSGDPYFHTAKLAKAVPKDAIRKNHEDVRVLFKSTTLGISYLMGKYGLSGKITQDTGKVYTPDEAQELIDLFFDVYSVYAEYIEQVQNDYQDNAFLQLADGWVMFGDNDNHRSVANCPIQGMGAVILRKAIQLAQDAGLKVIFPLHDALYIEFPEKHLHKIDILYDCMREAFCYYFKGVKKEWAYHIRMDIDVWGSSLSSGTIDTPQGRSCKSQQIYIDPRSTAEYARFSKYFLNTKN